MKIPEIKIEKGIKIPERESISNAVKNALLKMKKGDSFLYSFDRRTVLRLARKMKIKILTRKENGSGFRIWRIK